MIHPKFGKRVPDLASVGTQSRPGESPPSIWIVQGMH